MLCLRCCVGYNHRLTLGRAHLGPSISQTPKGEPGLPALQLQSISSRPSLAKELKPSTWGLRSPRPGTVRRAGPSPDPWQLCHCHNDPNQGAVTTTQRHSGTQSSGTHGPSSSGPKVSGKTRFHYPVVFAHLRLLLSCPCLTRTVPTGP